MFVRRYLVLMACLCLVVVARGTLEAHRLRGHVAVVRRLQDAAVTKHVVKQGQTTTTKKKTTTPKPTTAKKGPETVVTKDSATAKAKTTKAKTSTKTTTTSTKPKSTTSTTKTTTTKPKTTTTTTKKTTTAKPKTTTTSTKTKTSTAKTKTASPAKTEQATSQPKDTEEVEAVDETEADEDEVEQEDDAEPDDTGQPNENEPDADDGEPDADDGEPGAGDEEPDADEEEPDADDEEPDTEDETEGESDQNVEEPDEGDDEDTQEEETKEDNTTKPDGTPGDGKLKSDPCPDAKTCKDCEAVVPANSTQTCLWMNSSCELVSKEDAPPEDTCPDNEESADLEEEGSSFTSGLVMLMIVFGVAFAFRVYLENDAVSGGAIPAAYRQGSRSSHHRDTETVPLADDDEWGWEDSGHVELSSSTRAKEQEEDDLRMAMALSLSESPRTVESKSGTATRRTNSATRASSGSDGDWDDWDDESPSVRRTVTPAPVSAPSPPLHAVPNPPATRITGLGVKRQQAPPKRKTEEKPKEADIFASMGLSAKPTFSSRPSSSGGVPSTQTTPPAPSGLLAEAAEDVGGDAGSDWGDDSDLDDLLND